MKIRQLLLSAILLGLFLQSAYADWPVGRRQFTVYTSVTFYNAKNSWDSVGHYKTDNGSKYSSQSLSIAGDYGISRRLDFKASIPFFQTDNAGLTATNFGYGEVTAGFNYNLININRANYTSVYVGGVFPLFTNTYSIQKGLDNDAVEVKLSNSGTINKLFGYKTEGYGVNDTADPSTTFGNAYYSVEGGYRYYLQTYGAREITYSGTLGFALDKLNQLAGGVNGVVAVTDNPLYTQAIRDQHQFAYTETSFSYGHKFSRRISTFVTGFYTVAGRNAAQGYGLSFQLIAKL